MTTTSAHSGYVEVNDLTMYYEVHGTGQPLVLLHGAFSAIGTSFGALLPDLARTRQVIAFELQGHGHTADIDRPLSPEQMADDTVAALAELRTARADVFGYSMGAGVALQVALRHAAAVRKLVLASLSYTRSGFHPALLDGIVQLTPDALVGSPWHAEYTRLAPHPEAFATLVAKVTRLNRAIQDVPAAAIQAITAPTLLIVGDADIIRPEHAVELFRLRGGGVAGDLVGLPPAQLAILPGTTMRRWCSAPTCCGRSSRHSWTRPCPPAPEPHGA